MVGRSICKVCGNEIESAVASCPFCNHIREPEYQEDNQPEFRVVNLERGMPTVHDALKRLEQEVASCGQSSIRGLILIHGYGSSGKGGAIKDAVRKKMKLYQEQKKLSDVLRGEDCGKQSAHAKHLLKRFPMVKEYLLRTNPGITLVVI